MGRYVPPDVEGTVSGNQLHNKRHPIGSSAAPQTVRFEMPFPVWCGTCARPTIIGQGVRFNATKRRVGHYHSTPIFSFTFRHADCGGELEVRTDPAATEYVVSRGGRRREAAGLEDQDLVSPEALKRASLANLASRGLGGGAESSKQADREAAFAHLEKTIADRAALARASTRVDELAAESDRLGWDDPYARNALLRRGFRAGRKERERAAAADADVRARLGLDDDAVVLGPELDVDRVRAALVDFGHVADDDDDDDKALTKPLFAPGHDRNDGVTPKHGSDGARIKGKDVDTAPTTARSSPGPSRGPLGQANNNKSKSVAKKEKTREGLIQEIGRNTRKIKDPFLEGWSRDSPQRPIALAGLKRKRKREEEDATTSETPKPSPAPGEPPDSGLPEIQAPMTTGLVSYDSDSD